MSTPNPGPSAQTTGNVAPGPYVAWQGTNTIYVIGPDGATVAFGAAGGGAAISAGAASQNTGTVIFSNANSVSFGLNNGTLTASVLAGAAAGIGAIQASNTTYTSGTVIFSNANGLTFGSTAGGITGSYNSTQFAGTGTTFNGANLSGSMTQNSNGLQLSLSAVSQSVQTQASGNIAGNGTTFGGTNVSGSMTLGTAGLVLSLSAPSVGGAQTGISGIIVSNTTYTAGTVSFSNANGITFGSSGANGITASYNSTQFAGTGTTFGGTNISGSATLNSNGLALSLSGNAPGGGTLSVYGQSNTTQSSSGTIPATSLQFQGAGGVSVGVSNGSVVISGAAAGAAATASFYGASNTTNSSSGTIALSSLVVGGYGLISVGVSAGTLQISGPATTTYTPLSVGFSTGGNTAGTTAMTQSQIVLAGGNNITLSGSTNGSSMTISIAGGAGGGFTGGVSTGGNTAGNTGTQTGSFILAGGNNVTLSVGTAAGGNQTITVSAANQSNQTVGLYGVGNTTQNSSTTLDARTISYDALGAMTVGFSNGSVQLSAPATSSIVGAGGISVSTNGSTISVYENAITRLVYPSGNLTAISAPGNATISVQYVAVNWPITASRLDALVAWSGASSATTNTCAIAISAYAAIYTRNASTLSSLSSGSTQTTYTYASSTAGQTGLTQSAIRPISVPVNVSMTPGEYFVGFNFITATSSVGLSTTNLGQTLSIMGANQIQSALNYAEFGNATATSSNLYYGMGLYTAASTGMPASIGLASISQTGASLSQANIALVFRNA